MTRCGVTALALALLLAFTSVASGAARGQARVAGQVVLCVGGVTAQVQVDARGQPVSSVHVCPDCVLGALAAVAAAAAAVPRQPQFLGQVDPLPRSLRRSALQHRAGLARAPPADALAAPAA